MNTGLRWVIATRRGFYYGTAACGQTYGATEIDVPPRGGTTGTFRSALALFARLLPLVRIARDPGFRCPGASPEELMDFARNITVRLAIAAAFGAVALTFSMLVMDLAR